MENSSDIKGTILIIFILIMFSSKLWTISFDIIKSLLYLVIAIYLITYLNPPIGKNIQESLQDFYNIESENNIFRIILSKISYNIMIMFNPNYKYNLTTESDNYINNEVQPDDLKYVENKNLDNYGDTNNKMLTP